LFLNDNDKNLLFDRGSIGEMGLCVEKNKSQYMGVLGYPVARGIVRDVRAAKWPFIQWLYALTMISGELAPTSRLPKYRFLTANSLDLEADHISNANNQHAASV